MRLSVDPRFMMEGRRRQAAAMQWDRTSLMGETAPVAGLICLFGLMLHFVLSYPLLDGLGVLNTTEGGPPWQKIHPGSICIILSLFVLLFSRADPISRFAEISWKLPAFCLALAINLLLSVWVVYRSGIAGGAFMVDTHWTPVIAAIVLSYAPRSMCRRALYAFIALAGLNSAIGIYEGVFKVRVLPFDPTWAVLKEEYFRASALIGHPLTNGQLTSIAIFILLGTSISARVKVPLLVVFFLSLVAFGGRIALAYSVAGLGVWALLQARKAIRSGHLSVLGILLLLTSLIVLPIILIGGLSMLIDSSLGDRLAETGLWDQSANARVVALDAIRMMSPQEWWLGVSLERESEIAYSLSRGLGADIENPWILMFMFLGAIGFAVWLIGLVIFVGRLARGIPLAYKLAILSYYVVGSTSNSFGRKDSIYCIMVGAVLCGSAQLRRAPVRPIRFVSWRPDAAPYARPMP